MGTFQRELTQVEEYDMQQAKKEQARVILRFIK